MTADKTKKWIFVAFLVALSAAGGLMAWAAPQEDGKDGGEHAAAALTGPASAGAAASSVSVPASARRSADSRIPVDVELVGTAIIEGGTSFAIFQSASGTRFVREGDEIVGGVRLVQIRRNRIDVERNGVREEIRLGYSEGARQHFRPGSNPAGSGVEARARVIEYLKAKGVLPQG